MAFKRGRKGSNGNTDYARITTLFESDRELPKFLKAKWTVTLNAGDEYFEKLKEKVEEAEEKGALFIDVAEPKDNDGNLVLTVAAFEPKKGNGKKKRRDDDDDEDEKPRGKKRDEEEEEEDERPARKGGRR